MIEGDAMRRKIAAMSPEQQADLYDVVAADLSRVGVTKAMFVDNMDTLSSFNETMRPARDAWDAAVATGPESVRDARRTWEEAVEALRLDRQSSGKSMVEWDRERQEALRRYEETIYACRDEGVIAAYRAYVEELQVATNSYAQNLR